MPFPKHKILFELGLSSYLSLQVAWQSKSSWFISHSNPRTLEHARNTRHRSLSNGRQNLSVSTNSETDLYITSPESELCGWGMKIMTQGFYCYDKRHGCFSDSHSAKRNTSIKLYILTRNHFNRGHKSHKFWKLLRMNLLGLKGKVVRI